MKTKKLPSQAETEVEFWPDSPEILPEDAVIIYTDHSHLNLDSDRIRSLVNQITEAEGRQIHRLEIVLTGAEKLHSLNKLWKNADYDTDVLSFSFTDGSAIDAAVYVSLDFAQESCKSYGVTFIQEASRYIVHGLLHLIGYEDNTIEAKKVMRQKEDQYLLHAGLIKV